MKARILILLAILFVLSPISASFAQEHTIASTPPMGWNSWNKFACNVSEDLMRQTADAMVKSGMKDAGYQYVVIDDCWQVDATSDGNIVCRRQALSFRHEGACATTSTR